MSATTATVTCDRCGDTLVPGAVFGFYESAPGVVRAVEDGRPRGVCPTGEVHYPGRGGAR